MSSSSSTSSRLIVPEARAQPDKQKQVCTLDQVGRERMNRVIFFKQWVLCYILCCCILLLLRTLFNRWDNRSLGRCCHIAILLLRSRVSVAEVREWRYYRKRTKTWPLINLHKILLSFLCAICKLKPSLYIWRCTTYSSTVDFTGYNSFWVER